MPRVTIVTGAGAGIGREIALALSEKGDRVACVDRNESAAMETAFACRNGAMSFRCDVGDADQVRRTMEDIQETMETPAGLVNNAGIILRKPVLETSPDEFHELIRINLGGVFHFTQAMARVWRAAELGGQIVNISSGHASIGGYDRTAYASSKAAIEAFTRNCAVELGQYGIIVNAIAPGFTFTEMSRQSLVGERKRMVERRLPIRRIAEAREVATAVIALLDGQIPYMIGQTLKIDGGWSNSDVDYSRLMPESDDL